VRNNTTYQTMSCTPNNLPVIYERDITNIYLQYFTEDEDTLVSTTDIDRLIEIAGKCPTVSGYAVYDAQALLRTINPEIEFDWVFNCENAGLRIDDYEEKLLPQSEGLNEIIIAPNPAKDIINLSGISESCQLQVYSLNGVLLKNIIVAKNISQLDVSDLENGIYFMKLQGQLTNSVYKLVIAK
jgi:hypothetical protein